MFLVTGLVVDTSVWLYRRHFGHFQQQRHRGLQRDARADVNGEPDHEVFEKIANISG